MTLYKRAAGKFRPLEKLYDCITYADGRETTMVQGITFISVPPDKSDFWKDRAAACFTLSVGLSKKETAICTVHAQQTVNLRTDIWCYAAKSEEREIKLRHRTLKYMEQVFEKYCGCRRG